MRASVRCSVTLLRGKLSKDTRVLPGRCSQSCLPWLNYTITWTPGRPFHDTAQAASNLTISSLLPVCWFAICSVAVCTCGGYTAQASLIDFCLCLLKVVSGYVHVVGVCTGCDVLTARAYSALLSKWCFSTSSFGGDVKLSVREYVILLLVIPLKRYFKNKQNTWIYMQTHSF